MPAIAGAFAELGYRGTTTAALAKRCGVRENVLYRTWSSKREMFLDAIEYFYVATVEGWAAVEARPRAKDVSAAEAILDAQARTHGHLRLYRVMFAAMTEDDAAVRAGARDVYRRLHAFIRGRIAEHRAAKGTKADAAVVVVDDELAAWAMIGLGAVADIQRELEVLSSRRRTQFMRDVGRRILG